MTEAPKCRVCGNDASHYYYPVIHKTRVGPDTRATNPRYVCPTHAAEAKTVEGNRPVVSIEAEKKAAHESKARSAKRGKAPAKSSAKTKASTPKPSQHAASPESSGSQPSTESTPPKEAAK